MKVWSWIDLILTVPITLPEKNDENWTWQVIVFDLWISALGVGHWSSASMAGHTTHDNYLKMLDILQRANTRGTIAVYR